MGGGVGDKLYVSFRKKPNQFRETNFESPPDLPCYALIVVNNKGTETVTHVVVVLCLCLDCIYVYILVNPSTILLCLGIV